MSTGGGGDCSPAKPCGSIDAAYQRAGAGDAIVVAAGGYGPQTVKYREAANGFAANVVVEPRGGPVSIAGLSIQSPHLTIRGVVLTAFTELVSANGGNANFGRIENVESTNQIYITGSDNTAVVDSRLHPGLNSVAIAVTPHDPRTHVPTNTIIENNEVGPAWASTDWQALGLHNESIHVEGAANLAIRRNLIWEGATSASLQIDTSLGSLTGIVVENNYIAGCGLRTPPAGAVCAAFHTVGYSNQAGVSPQEIIVRNNTVRGDIVDYAFTNSNSPSGEASGNVVDGTVGCSGATMRGNLLGPHSFSDCRGNTLDVPAFTAPAFGGISWGMVPRSPGAGLGVPAGAGFRPIAPGSRRTAIAATTTTVAPTPTAVNATTGSFGATSPGTGHDEADSGYKFGSVYSLRQRASVAAFRFYAQGGTAGQRFTPAIYRVDSTGEPTALAVLGQEVTVAAAQAAGWVTSALPATTLAPGQYLLSLVSGPNGRGASAYYRAEDKGGVWNANAEAAPSASWGAANAENDRWSFVVDYR